MSDLLYRFWAKVDHSGECWMWTAYGTADGYGQFWDGERKGLAHRWSYERFVGPIPPGMQLDHLCRNRRCVNPSHLEPVTHRVNSLRGVGPSAQNARKDHCNNGHAFDEANTYVMKSGGGRSCRACNRVAVRRYKARLIEVRS